MNKIINEFFDDVNFTKEGREYLLPIFEKLCSNEDFVLAKKQYEAGEMTKDLLLEACQKISDKTGVHHYTTALLLLVLFTEHLKKLYIQKGYSLEIYKNSVLDLHYKAIESKLVKGVWGTFVADWQYKFFTLERFGVGRLQAELFDLPESCKELTSSPNAIKIHIPRSGEPLTPESIDTALAKAKIIFKEYIAEPVPIVCSSYLLYSNFAPLYKEGSNLKKFVSRFTIVAQTDDKAGDYPNMWRLFDMDYTGNIDDYPERTSLHRAFKQYLKDGKTTGVAIGYFFAD